MKPAWQVGVRFGLGLATAGVRVWVRGGVPVRVGVLGRDMIGVRVGVLCRVTGISNED